MKRARLAQRRHAVTHTIAYLRGDGTPVEYAATVGLDDAGWPKEVFLSGAKEGSDMAAALADTAVALSVALQHGVKAEAMALSVSRVAGPDGTLMPGSIVGAALDLVAEYERTREAAEDGVCAASPLPAALIVGNEAAAIYLGDELVAERVRQIVGEGYSAAHDDGHDRAELARAAAGLALWAASATTVDPPHEWRRAAAAVLPWTLDKLWGRPPRRLLVIAGALILAELARLDRKHGERNR